MENIKLIIWDLDDCFWDGTLSDGDITPITKNIELVKTLTDRGIINAICSKNDFDKVEREFINNAELGKELYDLFVFNSIDWTAKGNRIKKMISDMNLRCVNVLFVDDNFQNLKEAQFVCEGIQVALPDELNKLMDENPECFVGRDDSNHERLNQYKILENKVQEKSAAGSNEEFLIQSDIRVEMIEDNLDYDRIYEMIHRNNQLNFTKDRISKEEVVTVFSDDSVRSGVVRVCDKYGDHGIVGCYALRDNKLLQFVFSCRVLGMGIEQYVYGMLGFPEITVVGEVASELVKGEIPAYINQKADEAGDASVLIDDVNRMIIFGTCPLRPVWGYLEPKIKNIRFVDYVPPIPVCNLGMMFEDYEYNQECLRNVKIFAKDTFCQDIIDGNLDWLLITFTLECEMYKYTNTKTGKRFYASKLTPMVVEPGFLEDYTETRITPEVIYEEISNLCRKLAPNVKIIIQTVTDLVFELPGKNQDYYDRIECNKVAERLERENSNVFLVDIRKYACNTSDFFDSTPNHYNRAIGYKLAMDILGIMGIGKTDASTGYEQGIIVPENAFITEVSLVFEKEIVDDEQQQEQSEEDYNEEVPIAKDSATDEETEVEKYVVGTFESELVCFILNAQMVIRMKLADNVSVTYEIYRDRTLFVSFKDVDDEEIIVNINKRGIYRLCAFITCEDVTEEVWGAYIPYNEFNYAEYIDAQSANYAAAKETLGQFILENTNLHNQKNRLITQMAALMANGSNIAGFFEDKGIETINVYATDWAVLSLILEQLNVSKVKIGNVYCADMVYRVSSGGGLIVNPVDGMFGVRLANTEKLLFAGSSWASKEWEFFRKILPYDDCMYTLDYVLSYMMTKTFFPSAQKLEKLKKMVCVRSADYTFGYFYYNKNAILAEEKERVGFKIDAYRKAIENDEPIEIESLKNVDSELVMETTAHPGYTPTEIETDTVLSDVSGEFFNITDGFRKTLYQPETYMGKIYICGDFCTLGVGNSDENTIASQLQKIVGSKYKVENCAWNWAGESDAYNMLRMINKMEFSENDILIVFMRNSMKFFENQYNSWFNFDALDNSYIKIDTHPLFYNMNRPPYFLLHGVYTPECNRDIAKLIKDKLSIDMVL